jgi:hypothetical protein
MGSGSVTEIALRRWPLPDDFTIREFPWLDRVSPEDWFMAEVTMIASFI